MPNYRRRFVPYATYFFTIVTYQRRPFLTQIRSRSLLREAIQVCQNRFPFELIAIVLLPDHVHAMFRLPEGDMRYPMRLGFIKKEFTKHYLESGGIEGETSMGLKLQGRRGVWQPRYHEHTIEYERDFENHFDYLHYNPVKHGLVQQVADWPYSSFHRWVKHGIYPKSWCSAPKQLKVFEQIAKRMGE